ncbi:MAG: hypothetical protein ACFB21_07825 [Opitutales bacterium]
MNAPVAPTRVLGGQLDDEGVALLASSLGSRMIPALWGKLHRDELAMPGVDRLRRHETGDLHEHLTPEAAALFRQTAALIRIEPDAPALGMSIELPAQDAILFDQILGDALRLAVHPARHHRQGKKFLRFQAGISEHLKLLSKGSRFNNGSLQAPVSIYRISL